jgi:hypothetical protein
MLNLEEKLVRKVLLECRLLKKNSRAKGNGLVSPMYQLWEDFIREHGVDIEWSMCKKKETRPDSLYKLAHGAMTTKQ